MAFCLYRSNRVERLADALAQVVFTPLEDPFARECIVVQGPGMERWLSSVLAARRGVWANPHFPFPRAVVELALDAVLGAVPEEDRWYAPDRLVWLVARVIEEQLAADAHPSLRELASYLAKDGEGDRLMASAAELAHTFDQCIVYRPDVVLGWERGEGPEPHGCLWRAIRQLAPSPHLAQRMRDLARAFERGATLAKGALPFPERICLFGLSTLPPAFLDVLRRVSEQRDVHLFMLTPSAEYWGDFSARRAEHGELESFLASIGKVGRELIEMLVDVPYVEPLGELFEDPRELVATGSVLTGLQSDLMTLTSRTQHGGGASAPDAAREDDDSIGVHVCHSETRELEVLREQLRARFERDPTLAAHDVVVLAPDIERYAAAIHSVFARQGEDDPAHIPYHVADRKAAKQARVVEAFQKLCALARSRLVLSEVLDLLHTPVIRERFAIEDASLDRIERWLSEAGARWGIDGAHRERAGQPALHENTMRFALDRLVLGYAAKDGERTVMFETLPHGDVEGREALVLGRLARFLEALFQTLHELEGARTPAAWARTLGALLERMLSAEAELGYEHQLLSSALSELESAAERAGMRKSISLDSFVRELTRKLEQKRSSASFLSGGVTFCEHVPMRAIPFRVVGLLGMDDESFPRKRGVRPFDLLANAPRLGDRNLRDDDQQLFLETLLSVRETLIITYVGRSPKDDGERPASVLVDRFLALLAQHFVLTNDARHVLLGFAGSIAEHLVHVHALHRFDARYFRTPEHRVYFSYDQSACEAARALYHDGSSAAQFVSKPLAPREPVLRELSLEALLRFYRHPPRAFLEQRLGVYLPQTFEESPDREPILVEGLERYRIADDLLKSLSELPLPERHALLRKQGRLPPGTLGEAMLARVERDVAAVEGALPKVEPHDDVPFTLELTGVRLVGRVTQLEGARRVERIISKASAKAKLSSFIRHLAYCATHEHAGETVLVARDDEGAEVVTFAPVRDARERLATLVRLRAIGLCMPLPFSADIAYDCARALLASKDVCEACEKALRRGGAPGMSSFAEDAHVRQLWSPDELARFSELVVSDGEQSVSFVELVRAVMLPMLEHVSDGERA